MRSYKEHFSRFLNGTHGSLHFAAHSHHYWPDCTLAAQERAWLDAARMADDKWGHIFGELIPKVRAHIARILSLPSGEQIAFAPNTHELLVRLHSSLPTKPRVLSTDGEFHSFRRQTMRWQEAGQIELELVPVQDFATFADRFTAEARKGEYDLIYVSQVFFNSGFAHRAYEELLDAVPETCTIVVDGYHGFMALPTDLSEVAHRVSYMAGGYKYAMAGEGACFIHLAEGVAPRPVNTGWFAGFGALEGALDDVVYAGDGMRMAGATFDPTPLYRFDAVQTWLLEQDLDVAKIHGRVAELQELFLQKADAEKLGQLLPGLGAERGHFLCFRTERAGALHNALREAGVLTDFRDDRLRFGFALYHEAADVEELAHIIDKLDI